MLQRPRLSPFALARDSRLSLFAPQRTSVVEQHLVGHQALPFSRARCAGVSGGPRWARRCLGGSPFGRAVAFHCRETVAAPPLPGGNGAEASGAPGRVVLPVSPAPDQGQCHHHRQRRGRVRRQTHRREHHDERRRRPDRPPTPGFRRARATAPGPAAGNSGPQRYGRRQLKTSRLSLQVGATPGTRSALPRSTVSTSAARAGSTPPPRRDARGPFQRCAAPTSRRWRAGRTCRRRASRPSRSRRSPRRREA